MGSGRLSIVIYHRVLDKADVYNPHEVHKAAFDQQMKWIKRFFNVLSLDEGIKLLGSSSLPPRALCVTFDDGYRDNCSNALPILCKHDLTATFFVSTSFLNGGIMWNDSIIETFRHTNKENLDLTRYGFGSFSLSHNRVSVLNEVIGKIKFLDFSERLSAVEDIKKQLDVITPTNLMMTHDEVRQLSNAGMMIGGHTERHPILTRLDVDEARKEITSGKVELESIIGKEITMFAYPNGKPFRDYEKEHVDLVREAGFKYAVSTAWGSATVNSDVLQLPRFTPWDKSVVKFMLRLYRNQFSGKEASV